jgi:hypothetical protein
MERCCLGHVNDDLSHADERSRDRIGEHVRREGRPSTEDTMDRQRPTYGGDDRDTYGA